jgi:hypothetical protein
VHIAFHFFGVGSLECGGRKTVWLRGREAQAVFTNSLTQKSGGFNFHHHGKRFRESTGTDNRRKAEAYLRNNLGEVGLGTYTSTASRVTVAEVVSLAGRNATMLEKMREEWPVIYHRTLLRDLRDQLRSIWQTKDPSAAELKFFQLQTLIHRNVDIAGARDRALQPPSVHAPLHAAVLWVRQNFSRLRSCKNADCRHPLFVAIGKQQFCAKGPRPRPTSQLAENHHYLLHILACNTPVSPTHTHPHLRCTLAMSTRTCRSRVPIKVDRSSRPNRLKRTE